MCLDHSSLCHTFQFCPICRCLDGLPKKLKCIWLLIILVLQRQENSVYSSSNKISRKEIRDKPSIGAKKQRKKNRLKLNQILLSEFTFPLHLSCLHLIFLITGNLVNFNLFFWFLVCLNFYFLFFISKLQWTVIAEVLGPIPRHLFELYALKQSDYYQK